MITHILDCTETSIHRNQSFHWCMQISQYIHDGSQAFSLLYVRTTTARIQTMKVCSQPSFTQDHNQTKCICHLTLAALPECELTTLTLSMLSPSSKSGRLGSFSTPGGECTRKRLEDAISRSCSLLDLIGYFSLDTTLFLGYWWSPFKKPARLSELDRGDTTLQDTHSFDVRLTNPPRLKKDAWEASSDRTFFMLWTSNSKT